MTARAIEQIISTTAVGHVEIRTADGHRTDIDPELTQWEVSEPQRCIHTRNCQGEEKWINIDQITTIKRIEP